jgi:hypothetical protein
LRLQFFFGFTLSLFQRFDKQIGPFIRNDISTNLLAEFFRIGISIEQIIF